MKLPLIFESRGKGRRREEPLVWLHITKGRIEDGIILTTHRVRRNPLPFIRRIPR